MIKFPKIPYAVSLYLYIDLWAILCALFGIILIISLDEFATVRIERVVISSFLFYVLIAALAAPSEYGLLRFFGLKKERKDAKILNDNIQNGHIPVNIPDKTLKDIFYALTKQPAAGAHSTLTYAGGITLLTALTAVLISVEIMNIIIILTSGVIVTVILALFGNFFTENFIAPVLKKCRAMLKARNIKVEENQLFQLKNRFTYFILLLALVVFIVLSFVPEPSMAIIILSLLGLIMAAIISKILFTSIHNIFLEIEDFAKSLPKKEKAIYSTGSLSKEATNLSKNLNQSAEDLYKIRGEERKLKDELQERLNELNKWYKLTVGRELKMIELKNKIKQLENEKIKK